MKGEHRGRPLLLRYDLNGFEVVFTITLVRLWIAAKCTKKMNGDVPNSEMEMYTKILGS